MNQLRFQHRMMCQSALIYGHAIILAALMRLMFDTPKDADLEYAASSCLPNRSTRHPVFGWLSRCWLEYII